MNSNSLNYDKMVIKIMKTHRTKVSQLKAIKLELCSYLNENEAEKIAKQTMKEYNPINKPGTVPRLPPVDSSTLLRNLEELIAFIDDWNFSHSRNKIFVPTVAYCRQLTGWTCGPASIRMVLETLINEKVTEKKLIKILNSNTEHGTLQKDMILIGEHDKYRDLLQCQHADYGSLTKLTQLTENGWLCIVEWSLNDCPHYALFSHEDGTAVYLNDPFFGELYQVEKYDFIQRWNVYQKNYKAYNFVLRDRESCRWYLAFKAKKKRF